MDPKAQDAEKRLAEAREAHRRALAAAIATGEHGMPTATRDELEAAAIALDRARLAAQVGSLTMTVEQEAALRTIINPSIQCLLAELDATRVALASEREQRREADGAMAAARDGMRAASEALTASRSHAAQMEKELESVKRHCGANVGVGASAAAKALREDRAALRSALAAAEADKVRAEAERDEMWKLLECQHGKHLECSRCLGTTRAAALKGWRDTRSALTALETRHQRLREAARLATSAAGKAQLTDALHDLRTIVVALASPEPEPAEEYPPVDTMPRIGGRAFRCDCECNVFRKHRTECRFRCNGCGATFVGEPAAAQPLTAPDRDGGQAKRDVLHEAAQHVEKRWGSPSKPGKETP